MSEKAPHKNKSNIRESENQTNSTESTESKLSKYLAEFLEQKELIIKEAVLMGETRIQYCKGKDLAQIITDNLQDVRSKLKEICEIDIGNSKDAFQRFLDIFHDRKFLVKLDRIEGDKAKYPKRLIFPSLPKPASEFQMPSQEEVKQFVYKFDSSKFYWLNIPSANTTKKSAYVYLIIAVSVVLFGCLFPIWPLWVKLSVWWMLFAFLVGILVLCLLRIIIYFACFLFGYDVWLIPNLLNEKMSFMEGLVNPIICYYPRDDDRWTIAFRLSVVIALFFSILFLCTNREIVYQLWNSSSYLTREVYDYVSNKIVSYHNSTSSLSIVDKHNQILNQMN